MKSQELKQGITFDDVLLLPKKSEVTPHQVEVGSRFSRRISLNIPLVSSPMDTVTESRLAIALALEGGIGVIHKNLTPQAQAEEVARVKRFRNGLIENPITLSPDQTIADVVRIREEKGYKNVPITDKQGKLIGLITKFDYFWPEDQKMTIKQLMRPLNKIVTAPTGTNLAKAQQLIKQHKTPILLLVDGKGYLKGIVTRSDLEKNQQYPFSNKDGQDRLRVAAAIGVGEDSYQRALLLAEKNVDAIVIDTAHGHSKNVILMLKKLKSEKKFKDIDIIAGNVATPEGAKDLIDAGADAIKVGIGPGSICTTRIIAGVGVPQITAILNAVAGRGKKNIPIIADGGIKYSGDIVKALAAGASCAMIGQLFAATEESPGEVTYYNGRMYKVYRGMGSLEAMIQGSKDRYGQHNIKDLNKLVPEGIVGQTLYKGKLADHVYQLIGGLRSGMGYVGAKTILELQAKAEFIQITENSLRESHPHDVTITKEAPNYHRLSNTTSDWSQ
ncbi:MAG: IMP dehydrogenase [Candidatus Komeilibacteria bacterium]|nr:IMP dehydrogenase [Candidatus Komeilibacteria bacterium]